MHKRLATPLTFITIAIAVACLTFPRLLSLTEGHLVVPDDIQNITLSKEISSSLDCLSMSADGKRIVFASYKNNTIRVWDIQTDGKPKLTLHVNNDKETITKVVISADGNRIASVSEVRDDEADIIRIWDGQKGGEALHTMRAIVKDGVHDPVSAIAISPDGTLVAVGSQNIVRIWDTEKGGNALFTLNAHNDFVYHIAFIAGGKRVVSSCPGRHGVDDNTLKIWDARKGGDAIFTLRPGDYGLYPVALSADGKRIVTAQDEPKQEGYHETIKVWDAENGGDALCAMRGHTDDILSLAISRDGKKIASGSMDHTIKLWDAEKGGEALHTLRGHTDTVRCVAISGDGKLILSVSDDNTIKLWDAQKGGEALRTLKGEKYGRGFWYVAFTADDTHFVSRSIEEDHLQLWKLRVDK